MTQPLLIVAGSEASSLWHSQELYANAPGPKELFIVEGATHVALYDGEGVGKAMSKLSPFFTSNLGHALAGTNAARASAIAAKAK